MEWNSQQSQALTKVGLWLTRRDKPVFRLFGYAGTGKTTLAKHLAKQSGGKVLFAAYTGKAALVMRNNGCEGARTIHSLIYIAFSPTNARERIEKLKERIAQEKDPTQRAHMEAELIELTASVVSSTKPPPSFILNDESDLAGADLLVVDEVSMVDEDMARDLMSFGVPILVLGDPAQLPPVRGKSYFMEAKPDVMLTEIMRQARENPIIELASQVREGRALAPGRYGSSEVVAGRSSGKELLEFSQIIVGLNDTRRNVNQWARANLGFTTLLPVVGDRLICLKNNNQEGFLNGGMWEVGEDADEDPDNEKFVTLFDIKSLDTGIVKPIVTVHRHILVGDYKKKLAPWEWGEAEEFDYAYAITCHKSQGSQWPTVAIKDESGVFREDARRWLYTAITRAQEAVKVFTR